MKVPDPYLDAALESIAAIGRYKPVDEQAFQTDSMIQDAVLMRLQDVGENLNRLRRECPEFWEANAGENWKQAVGLRNIISHDYGRVRMDLIWTVITDDLVPLAESLQASLNERPPGTTNERRQ